MPHSFIVSCHLCVGPQAKAGPSDGGRAYKQEQEQEEGLQMSDNLYIFDTLSPSSVTLGDELQMDRSTSLAFSSEVMRNSLDDVPVHSKRPPTLLFEYLHHSTDQL